MRGVAAVFVPDDPPCGMLQDVPNMAINASNKPSAAACVRSLGTIGQTPFHA